MSSLEQASVLLAGALNQQRERPPNVMLADNDFLKITENVYLAIRSVNVPIGQASEFNSTEVAFPSAASTLGTRWMDSEQRFALNLQATQVQEAPFPAQTQLDLSPQTTESAAQMGKFSLPPLAFQAASSTVADNGLQFASNGMENDESPPRPPLG